LSNVFSIVTLTANESQESIETYVSGRPSCLEDLLDCESIREYIYDLSQVETVSVEVQSYIYGDGESENADEDDLKYFKKHFDEMIAENDVDQIGKYSFEIDLEQIFGEPDYDDESEDDMEI
jgi:hypothetical protein